MNVPKIYAVYLPQYYETQDNNTWWGEGFTDWTTVKMATPLFQGHQQPKEPLNENYYNLLEKEIMSWQASLAKQYGVDGFSFYHYYFGEGKMELEKPAENLLRWKDIDMPFYFCWANQSWVRTWSKFSGNVWAEKFDVESGNDNGLLVEQRYGDEAEWKRHFYYLLPFFRDERYIKMHGRPIFSILGPDDIPSLKDMIELWKELAKKEGIGELYILGVNTFDYENGIDAVIQADTPVRYRRDNAGKVMVNGGVYCIDYEDYLADSAKWFASRDIKTYYQGMCGYDTTPRRGNGGECILNRSPQVFQNYMIEVLKKTIYYKNEFVVINAWNEWGEGMYLEPDKLDGYKYLEAIRMAKSIVSKIEKSDIDITIDNNTCQNNDIRKVYLKNKTFLNIYYSWLQKEIDGEVVFANKLRREKVGSVSIYGMGNAGVLLLKSLKHEGIEVQYGIDIAAPRDRAGIVIYRPEDSLPLIDGVIITVYDKGEIYDMLKKKLECKIFHLKDFLL